MNKLGDAMERQQAVQRKRTTAWAIFGILLPVSLLFWFEVIFAFGHLPEIGILQLSAELIVALIATGAAVHMFRSGIRFNRMLTDTSRLLGESGESE